jgi:type IV secretion system protein VirB1
MLDLALVLALSEACAPSVAPQTLAAIAHVESRFDPLAIGVDGGPRPPRRPRSAAEAARRARTLIARGADIDLGLAQINSANLGWLGLSVEDAFDPCRNLAAAARVLQGGYRPLADTAQARQAALRIALSRYNTGDPRRGVHNGYVARVERAAAALSLTIPAAPVAAPAEAPADAPPPWDVFARPPHGVLVFSNPTDVWSHP